MPDMPISGECAAPAWLSSLQAERLQSGWGEAVLSAPADGNRAGECDGAGYQPHRGRREAIQRGGARPRISRGPRRAVRDVRVQDVLSVCVLVRISDQLDFILVVE